MSKKYEVDADYTDVCTNNKYELSQEDRNKNNNDNKSYDCNICARLCYLNVDVSQMQDVYCMGKTVDQVEQEQTTKDIVEEGRVDS